MFFFNVALLNNLDNIFEKYGEKLERLDSMPKLTLKAPVWWWEEKDDRNLLIGTRLYGYGKTKELKEDDTLGFSEEALKQRLSSLWDKKTPEQKKELGFAAENAAAASTDEAKNKEKEEEKAKEEEEEEESEEEKPKGKKAKGDPSPLIFRPWRI